MSNDNIKIYEDELRDILEVITHRTFTDMMVNCTSAYTWYTMVYTMVTLTYNNQKVRCLWDNTIDELHIAAREAGYMVEFNHIYMVENCYGYDERPQEEIVKATIITNQLMQIVNEKKKT